MTENPADRNLCRLFTCKNTVYAKELCEKHYRRQYRHGSPHIVKKAGRPRKTEESYAA
jgi:hypothetical protein